MQLQLSIYSEWELTRLASDLIHTICVPPLRCPVPSTEDAAITP